MTGYREARTLGMKCTYIYNEMSGCLRNRLIVTAVLILNIYLVNGFGSPPVISAFVYHAENSVSVINQAPVVSPVHHQRAPSPKY